MGSHLVELAQLLKFAIDNKSSDLHLQAGSAPMMRINGIARFVQGATLTDAQVRNLLMEILPPSRKADLDRDLIQGIDFSYSHADLGRFRCSAFQHLNGCGVVLRVIQGKIPSFEDLMLPPVIHDIARSQRGLTLLTGTTGSGKSTTLASMIDLINETYRCKIVTIEDPIEYVHTNKKAMVSQIELGTDTPSFDQALRQALRQDPDVILVGELRDVETLKIALRAADTGHQVFSTLHSSNAAQTIERIIAMFPADEHSILLSQLATNVEAIISQRLVTTTAGGRRPAVEVLRGSAVTEKFIFERRLGELLTYIETGESGMQSFDQHLLKMYQEKAISGTEAMRWATNPEMMGMALRGIRRIGSGGGVVMLEKA